MYRARNVEMSRNIYICVCVCVCHFYIPIHNVTVKLPEYFLMLVAMIQLQWVCQL